MYEQKHRQSNEIDDAFLIGINGITSYLSAKAPLVISLALTQPAY